MGEQLAHGFSTKGCGECGDIRSVTNGVLQGSILSPVLINIFKNDLDPGAVDSLKGREALQKHVDKPEGWAVTNHMK